MRSIKLPSRLFIDAALLLDRWWHFRAAPLAVRFTVCNGRNTARSTRAIRRVFSVGQRGWYNIVDFGSFFRARLHRRLVCCLIQIVRALLFRVGRGNRNRTFLVDKLNGRFWLHPGSKAQRRPLRSNNTQGHLSRLVQCGLKHRGILPNNNGRTTTILAQTGEAANVASVL